MKLRIKIRDNPGLFLFFIVLLGIPFIPLVWMWIVLVPKTFWQTFGLAILSVILYFIYLVIEFVIIVVAL